MSSLISDTQILEVLRRQNRWWQDGSVLPELAPTIRRLAFYEVQSWLNQPNLKRAIVLSGARRVGKTVVLHQVAQAAITTGTKPRKIVYITFEDPTLTQTRLRNVLDLYEKNIEPIDAQTIILLDEIHYATEWGRELMVIMREFPRTRIVASGSAAVLLRHTASHETAIGRWLTVHVPTLSFYEYLLLRQTRLPDLPHGLHPGTLHQISDSARQHLISESELLQREFNRYLLQGGFPASVDDQWTLAQVHQLIREDVIDKALKRDMTQLYGVRSLNALDQLFVYLCFNLGGIVEKNTIAKAMGVTAYTIERYLHHLEDAHLLYRLEQFHQSGKKSLKSRPKIYVADSTLRNAAILRGDDVFGNEREVGAIVEAMIFKHLHAFYYYEQPRAGYWRDARTDKEVDFLFHFPDGRQVACEVKYQQSPTLSAKEGLMQLMAQQPQTTQALLITKNIGDFGPIENGRVMQVPAFLFAYLLGHAELQRWTTGVALRPKGTPYGQESQLLSGEAVKHLPPTQP